MAPWPSYIEEKIGQPKKKTHEQKAGEQCYVL